jgi:protein deglycase
MKKVVLLLSNGFEEYEASVFTDVLGWTRIYGNEKVNVTTVGLHEELKCTWNLIVKPECLIDDINIRDYDALAIPGGFEKAGFYVDAYNSKFLQMINDFYKLKKIIASVCVGALPIGKSGILLGKKATTYHLLDGLRRKQLSDFGAIIEDKHIVVDDNIITSSSPATGLDVAFLLLEKLTSKENCEQIRYYMGFNSAATSSATVYDSTR